VTVKDEPQHVGDRNPPFILGNALEMENLRVSVSRPVAQLGYSLA